MVTAGVAAAATVVVVVVATAAAAAALVVVVVVVVAVVAAAAAAPAPRVASSPFRFAPNLPLIEAWWAYVVRIDLFIPSAAVSGKTARSGPQH